MEAKYVQNGAYKQLIGIISERDRYKNDLAIARLTIVELESQNQEYDRMLNAYAAQSLDSEPAIAADPVYLIGNWVSLPSDYPLLRPIEGMWQKGNLQQALCQLPALLHRSDLDHRHRVNTRLLYSALLHQSRGNLPKALYYAEEGLAIALKVRLHELAGKAQYWRGVCYMMLDEHAKADWCFVLASHLDHHGPSIKEFRGKARQALEAMSDDDPRRVVPEDFLLHCNAL